MGYDTKVITKQRTRKASTSDTFNFLLDDRNPGHQIALLPCHMLVGHLTRRQAPSKRSFRASICRCLTASIGGTTTLIQPKQTLFFPTKGTSIFIDISFNLSTRSLSLVASVPARRQDKNFLAMIKMFCSLLGGIFDSIES